MSPKVLWITVLSAAGGKTIAAQLAKRLQALGEQLVLLYGDGLREVFRATEASKIRKDIPGGV
jgi:adenylylsulfate kinase-like enzyme